MAQINPGTTFTGQNPTLMQRSLDENILNLDPRDTPLLTLLGGLDGAAGKFSFLPSSNNIKYEWMEDTLGWRSVKATGGGTTATIQLDTNTHEAAKLEPGHILLNGTEQMWVSSVNTSNDTIQVTRTYGGTTPAVEISAPVDLKIIGMARLEGAESDPIAGTTVTIPYNYTQIVHRELSESGTMEKMDLLGKGDPWQYEAAKQVPNMLIEIEHQILYGIRQAGSATTPRAFGGVKEFIETNVSADLGHKVTKEAFEAAALAMFQGSGGGDKYAIVSPTNYVTLTSMFTTEEKVYHTEGGMEYWWGMSPLGIYTKFGKINLYIDRWIDDSFIPIIDLNNVGMKTLRPFFIEPLAKGGDYHKQETIWEGTLCMRGDKSHALINGIDPETEPTP